MKAGRVVETGTYQELKARNVNFSAWVTDVVHIDDDPTRLIENMSEIRLDPNTSTGAPTTVSPLRPPLAGNLAHLKVRRKSKPRSSPLASAAPINADNNSIRQIMELNSTSMQNSNLNEHTISKMIERSQTSVLTGTSTRPPTNFANQDVVSRTIEANQLTVHSIHNFDVGTMQGGSPSPSGSPYILFFSEGTGALTGGLLFLFFFLSSHAFRLLSDVWLMYVVDNQSEVDAYQRNIIILSCLSVIISISIVIRGYTFLRIIISKGSCWHTKILEVKISI
jgi:hypothetical protein